MFMHCEFQTPHAQCSFASNVLTKLCLVFNPFVVAFQKRWNFILLWNWLKMFSPQNGFTGERLEPSGTADGPELWAEEVNSEAFIFILQLHSELKEQHILQICLHWWLSGSWESQDGSAGEAGRCSRVLLPTKNMFYWTVFSLSFISICVPAACFLLFVDALIFAVSYSLAQQWSCQAAGGLWWVCVWTKSNW